MCVFQRVCQLPPKCLRSEMFGKRENLWLFRWFNLWPNFIPDRWRSRKISFELGSREFHRAPKRVTWAELPSMTISWNLLFFVLKNKGPIRKVALKGQVAKTKKKHEMTKNAAFCDTEIFPFSPHAGCQPWKKPCHINPRPPNPGGRRLKVQLPDGDEKLEILEFFFGW